MRGPGGPVVSEQGDPPGRIAQKQIEIAVAVDVVQLGHTVTAARQPDDRGVNQHKPSRAARAAVVIPCDGVLELPHHEIRQPITVEIAERRCIVKDRENGDVPAQLEIRRGA